MSEPDPFHEPELRELAEGLAACRRALDTWCEAVSERPAERDLAARLDRAARLVGAALASLASSSAGEPLERAMGGPGMEGTTSSIPLPDLIGFLADLGSNGVLRVEGADETFTLQLNDGRVVYAHGDAPPEGMRLGEVLVGLGLVRQEDLFHALRGQDGRETLGIALVREGYLNEEDLARALDHQTRGIFLRLFRQQGARFRFSPGEQMVSSEDVRLNATALLLDAARVVDEEAQRAAAQPA